MKWITMASAALILASCNTATTDSESSADGSTTSETREERNTKVVMESYAAMKKMDATAMLANIAPDAVDYGDGSMDPVKGADSVRASVGRWLSSVESMDVSDTTMMASGDKVWVAGTFSATYKDDIAGMPTKGKSFKVFDVDMFTFNDEGQITSHRSVQAPDVWFSQMGIPMPKK